MKVAAYQAPLEACYSNDAVALIGEQVRRCEAEDVELLCCPEGSLGGLADYVDDPRTIAIDATGGGGGGGGQLARVLAPLASDTVTTIVGFTEVGASAHLYNSAAVLHRGDVVGVYRKLHPAMRRSVYHAGSEMPVFTVGGLTFGIVICYDSTFPEPARVMASLGARLLFVPTNNGLRLHKGRSELVGEAKACDVARARENGVYVVRADVAGHTSALVSHGSSSIVDPDGRTLASARQLTPELIWADIDVAGRS